MLFAGDSDIGQLFRIFDLLGTPGPTKAVPWAGVETLPYYQPNFPGFRPQPFASYKVREPPPLPVGPGGGGGGACPPGAGPFDPVFSSPLKVRSSGGGDEFKLRELCESPAAEDLLRRMLTFDPRLRITAAEALRHPFLSPPSPARSPGALDFLLPPPPSPRSSYYATASTAAAASSSAAASSAAAASSSVARPTIGGTTNSGGALADGTVWTAWRLVEATQREHSDICRRALPAELVQERLRATLEVLRASHEFCRCDRTAHLAAAVLELFVRPHFAPPPHRATCTTTSATSYTTIAPRCRCGAARRPARPRWGGAHGWIGMRWRRCC